MKKLLIVFHHPLFFIITNYHLMNQSLNLAIFGINYEITNCKNYSNKELEKKDE